MILRIVLLLIGFASLVGEEPQAFYAAYQENPEQSITLCLISSRQASPLVFEYQQKNSQEWKSVKSKGHSLGFRNAFLFHKVKIEGLQPDTEYRVKEPLSGKSYLFKTLPQRLDRPIKFIVGGDIYHDSIRCVEKMNRLAVAFGPDFAILGGDIAYAAPPFSFMQEDITRWLRFLHAWSTTMVGKDGRLIPLMAVIGNHDTKGRFDETPKQAFLFYRFFPMPRSGYWKFAAGDYLRIWLLDSGHAHPVGGKQTEWLAQSLEEEHKVLFRFAVYHVPAFPSVRDFDNKRSAAVRKYWIPLFEKGKLTAAFEHHDHAYKRTFPIHGVVYFGDGAWGVEEPRISHQAPYLEKTASKTHFMVVTLEPSQVKVEAVNEEGEIFDEWKNRDPGSRDLGPRSSVEPLPEMGEAA
jgi:hypothetical protein